MRLLLFIIGFLLVPYVSTVSDTCNTKKDCNDCFRTPNCGWCNKDGEFGSCMKIEPSMNCTDDNLIKPEIKTDYAENPSTDEQPLQPQKITVEIGNQQEVTFDIKYKVFGKKDLDLYYLMDMSASMKDDKDQLSELGQNLVDEIGGVATNLRIGFGTFVDKTISPFVDSTQTLCKDCTEPYSFINRLSLTNNYADFGRQIRQSKISDNIDRPEGGFDALMQAMVCKKEIGWREKARHMLVYASDDMFHFAGQGRLGGLYRPNDMKCHMINNEYPEAIYNKYDFPSVSQISEISKENSINIIFAVTDTTFPTYRRVTSLIDGSAAKILSSNSSNIIEVIKERYENILTSVRLIEEGAKGNPYEISIKVTQCNSRDPNSDDTCINIQEDEEITFEVKIKLTECLENSVDDEINFYISGLPEQSTKVTVKKLCDCNCSPIQGSSLCSGKGTEYCGKCECDRGFWEDDCSCDGREISESEACENDNLTCSGHGNCICGSCKCDTIPGIYEAVKFTGEYCECNDYSCKKTNGDFCSGNGKCECGKCVCQDGFSGEDCSCSDRYCIAEGDTEVCSNHGICDCKKCKCSVNNVTNERYFGEYCDDCQSCDGRCGEFEKCIQNCASLQDCPQCPPDMMFPADKVEELPEESLKKCSYELDNGCILKFSYEKYDVNKMRVYYTDEICSGLKPWEIGLTVMGSVIGVCLLVIFIYSLYIAWQNKLDYQRFVMSQKEFSKSTANPLYKDPLTTHYNPLNSDKDKSQ